MKYIKILMIITVVFATTINDLSTVTSLMLILATMVSIVALKKSIIEKNISVLICFFTIWISVVMMPAFHLVEAIMKRYTQMDQALYDKMLSYSAPFFLFSACILLLCVSKRTKKTYIRNFLPTSIGEGKIKTILYFSIFLSLYCYSVGLGRMGADAYQLPFHLSGIINIFRWSMVPAMFAVFIENRLLQNKKIQKQIWILFGIWCVIEIFAWMSKIVMIYHMLPALLVIYSYKRPTPKTIARVVAPFLIVFLVMYPIIEIARNYDKDVPLSEALKDAQKESNDSDDGFSMLKPLNRLFIYPSQFAQNYDYIRYDDFFDFNRAPSIILMSGAARYQTVVIDQYPETANHSSGTSGLMDPILHGGQGLLYIVFLCLFLFAFFIDNLYMKGYYSVSALLLMKLFDYCAVSNISTLYDSVGMQNLFVELLCIYVACRYNFKNKSVVENAYNNPTHVKL